MFRHLDNHLIVDMEEDGQPLLFQCQHALDKDVAGDGLDDVLGQLAAVQWRPVAGAIYRPRVVWFKAALLAAMIDICERPYGSDDRYGSV